MRAALELGVVVGVCLMMGLGFMAMVGLEIFIDWVVEEYRYLGFQIVKSPSIRFFLFRSISRDSFRTD